MFMNYNILIDNKKMTKMYLLFFIDRETADDDDCTSSNVLEQLVSNFFD